MLPASPAGSTPTSQRLRANRQFNRVKERHRFRSLEKVLASTLGVTAFHCGSISANEAAYQEGCTWLCSRRKRNASSLPISTIERRILVTVPQSLYPTFDTAKTRSLAVIGSHNQRRS